MKRKKTKYGTFCIMGQQLNYLSELKLINVGVKKIKRWKIFKVQKIKPEVKWAKRDQQKDVKSLKSEHEFVAKNRNELRLGVKG